VTGDLPRRIAAQDFDAPPSAIEPGRLVVEPEVELPEPMDDVEAMSAMPPTPAGRDAATPPSAAAPVGEPADDSPTLPARPIHRVPAPHHVPMRMAGPPMAALSARSPGMPGPMRPALDGEDAQIERTATAPQLRRFIKSRAYVPMHELRRRFGINGGDDEVTPVDLERTRVFVGLPDREGRLLAELLRGGDIGYELSMDPISPIVVGVYPMRPVTRG
jgi:hypothetical protein